jgi:hypothetical protein
MIIGWAAGRHAPLHPFHKPLYLAVAFFFFAAVGFLGRHLFGGHSHYRRGQRLADLCDDVVPVAGAVLAHDVHVRIPHESSRSVCQ